MKHQHASVLVVCAFTFLALTLTASVASGVAAEKGIDMPITDAVARIVDGTLDVKTAIGQLMTRPITQE